MIRYTNSIDGITAEQLIGFFVGWPNPPSSHTHLKLLGRSDFVELAVDEDTSRVIGFVTAVSDRVLCAYIPLLEVLPEYQNRGIGTELTRRLLKRTERLYMVDLVCDKALQGFYEKLGLQPMLAMSRRNFDRQSGEDVAGASREERRK